MLYVPSYPVIIFDSAKTMACKIYVFGNFFSFLFKWMHALMEFYSLKKNGIFPQGTQIIIQSLFGI